MAVKHAGTPSPRRRYHHGALRRALLDRAKQVVSDSGVESVSMSSLAKDLQVSVAAPFRHFATREALLVALAEEGVEQMVQCMTEASAKHSEPLEAQRAGGVAYVRFAVAEPGYFRVVSHPSIAQASAYLREQAEAFQAAMDPVLGRNHPGGPSPLLARRSAGLLAAQSLTYGLARMLTDGILGPITPTEAEQLAIELTGVLGEGLLHEPND